MLAYILGLCVFFVCVCAYRQGFKDGRAIREGNPLPPIKNPLKDLFKPKKEDEFDKQIHELMNFDGEVEE